MLLALRSLWEVVAPPKPPTPPHGLLSAAPGGTWTVFQIGQGWQVETPIGTFKLLNPERVIQAARKSGATIR
jgi:hypothetical protein